MTKLRKMLGAVDSPYIISMMCLIETQNKLTIRNWCFDYAEKVILPNIKVLSSIKMRKNSWEI